LAQVSSIYSKRNSVLMPVFFNVSIRAVNVLLVASSYLSMSVQFTYLSLSLFNE
jgi:hypothetical protein